MDNQLQIRQKQTAVTIKQPDRTFTLNDLKGNFPTLTANEDRIIDARQSGYSFLDMTEKESQTAATGIIFKVSVICGCQLPTNDAHINALESEFLIFLNEFGYGKLTVDEVLLAFRMNSTFKLSERVEIYGALFNIDYASKVLRLYINERHLLDSKLTHKHRELEADVILEKEANARRERVKEQFAKFLNNETVFDLRDCYMQLASDGAFLKNNFDEKYMPSIQRGYKGNTLTRLSDWGERIEERFEAGRKAVIILFEAMKSTGRTEIYTDDLVIVHKGFDLPEESKVPDEPKLEY